jgi:asparagine synthase (glutamine-hydrolysing)
VDLVLRAYEAWGEESPNRIVGDFAFAIWNRDQQKLFCARDIMGVRPLYYYDGGNFFVFASELHALFRVGRVPKAANLGMVAEYLSAEIVTRDETLFKDISRLAPGHSLSVQAGRLAVTQYWNPDFLKVLRYSSEDQYVEHLIELFKNAVHSRLRSIGPVGIRMSGGLDSTTVLGMAQSMTHAGGVDAGMLETFSTIFPGEECDETDFIRRVNEFWGMEGHLVKRWIAPPQHYIDQARFFLDCPDSPNGAMNTPLKERVRDMGIRVLLTGCGGDEWFWGRNSLYADLVRGMRIRDLSRILKADDGNIRHKTRMILRYGLWPQLPILMQSTIQRIRGRHRTFPWITPALLRDSRLEDRITASSPRNVDFASFDQEEVYQLGTNAWMASNAEIEDLTSSKLGIEQRHPLWDRRIIEFALAIPGTLRWRPPYQKHILREAAQGLLPESVRLRQGKTVFSSIVPKALSIQGGESRIGSLVLAEMGWVNTEQSLSMTREILAANQPNPNPGWERHIWPVWMVYSMDVWLKESGLLTGS